MDDAPNLGFGLYLHWPFCQSKCPYCDFNSHVVSHVDQRRWQAAYLSEIDRLGRETQGRVLQSVFFGGGTPSLMDPELIGAILAKIRSTWPMSNDPEITLEANPGSVEAARFADHKDAGINRVSIGVQAMNDDALRQLGRLHSAKEALRAVEIGQNTFQRVNFDLIYARQGQDRTSWSAELADALSLGPTHLSLYQLTIEEGTVFHERNRRGLLRGLPDEDLAVDLFTLTQDMCSDFGLPAYEVSNHAKPGEESRHNLTYWRGGDYIGIGPGAHGRLTFGGTRFSTEAPKEPMQWLMAVERAGYGELPRHPLLPADVAAEYLLMGLRLYEGISIEKFEFHLGRKLNTTSVTALSSQGLVEQGSKRLKATRAGMLLLNSLLRELLSD